MLIITCGVGPNTACRASTCTNIHADYHMCVGPNTTCQQHNIAWTIQLRALRNANVCTQHDMWYCSRVCSRIAVVRVVGRVHSYCSRASTDRQLMLGSTYNVGADSRYNNMSATCVWKGKHNTCIGVDIQCGGQTVCKTTCLRHAFVEENIQYMYELDIQCEGQTVGKTTCLRHTFGDGGNILCGSRR
jgi:hypothetical protein